MTAYWYLGGSSHRYSLGSVDRPEAGWNDSIIICSWDSILIAIIPFYTDYFVLSVNECTDLRYFSGSFYGKSNDLGGIL